MATSTPTSAAVLDVLDVLIVGAGISGIGAAVHLQQQCPGKRYAILESQAGFGGTWRTHRYPGIRSDSDLFTFGYRFKPWMGKPIATAAEILVYLGEVIDEHGLAQHIHYRHGIQSASWDSVDKLWTVTATRPRADGVGTEQAHYRARFLWMCQGYYRHDEGYTPEWPGMAQFQGQVVHPQTWPADLDLTGKRVVVIGSGATAATLIPAIAGQCAHVTMLQRSPTFFITGRNNNDLADTLRQLDIPSAWTHEIVRRKILFDQANFITRCQNEPEVVRQELLAGVRAALGPGLEDQVDQHFSPRYRPWQQRIAFVPEADLFKAIRSGQASVVTDEIEHFTAKGIQLKSGKLLPADVVVTATGFHLSALGDIHFSIDGQPLDFGKTTTWRGAMFTGVPNLAWVFGYLRASWTLRTDMMGDLVCRLLQHMDAQGAQVVVPTLRAQDADMQRLPWITADNFSAGYVQRGVHLLPQQGEHQPWVHGQDYTSERASLPAASLDDGSLVYH